MSNLTEILGQFRTGKPSIPEAAPEISLDEALKLLSNERRRRVIRRLDTDVWTTLEVLAREQGRDFEDVDRLNQTEYLRYRVPLYQTHLPKLHSAGIVESDGSHGWKLCDTQTTRRVVELLSHADELWGGQK